MAYDNGPATYNVYGEFFFKQGRSSDFTSRGCVSLCIVMYKYEESEEIFCDEFVHKSRPYFLFIQKSVHAEEIIMNAIKKTEESEKVKCIRLELYSSMSPCSECCNKMHEFISERPCCEVNIAFSCVYRYSEDDQHKFALREVGMLSNVKLLDVFNVREWCILKDRGFLDMTPEALRSMQIWDQYWRRKLKEIMTSGTFQEDTTPYHEDIGLDAGDEPYDSYFLIPLEPKKVHVYEGRNRCVIVVLATVLLISIIVLIFLIYYVYQQFRNPKY